MKVLFIGGTGNISTACSENALRGGIELVHFNRGSKKNATLRQVRTITGDIRDTEAARRLLSGESFDAVVDWIAFTPQQIEADIELFREKTRQFIFISSASVYHKPPRTPFITESTPAYNPYWDYSQQKIACERLLTTACEKTGFPATIVRPSHTYGTGWVPTSFGSRDFTVVQRMLDGRPIVVHGDGQSLWTITHSEDFARGFTGLLGNPAAVGETFHITSDESVTWDQIHLTIAGILGREPEIVHVPSDRIAKESERFGPGLLGDKMYSVMFDNSKIKRTVPGFSAVIPHHIGLERSLRWLEDNPSQKIIDHDTDAIIDRLVASQR